jgi:hypothetical protein
VGADHAKAGFRGGSLALHEGDDASSARDEAACAGSDDPGLSLVERTKSAFNQPPGDLRHRVTWGGRRLDEAEEVRRTGQSFGSSRVGKRKHCQVLYSPSQC